MGAGAAEGERAESVCSGSRLLGREGVCRRPWLPPLLALPLAPPLP